MEISLSFSGLGIIISIVALWFIFFNTVNKNVKYRVIYRGGYWLIQSRTLFGWRILRDRQGRLIVFESKEDAGYVIELSLKAAKSDGNN